MQELAFEQVEEVSGGLPPVILWMAATVAGNYVWEETGGSQTIKNVASSLGDAIKDAWENDPVLNLFR
jgi:hypothetical protein